MAGLLEIRQAMRKQKPIVLLELTGPGHSFSFDDAYAMLRDLENKLPPLNPWAIDELRKHHDAGETLVDLQQTVLGAIEIGRSSRVPHLNINGCVPRAQPTSDFDVHVRVRVRVGVCVCLSACVKVFARFSSVLRWVLRILRVLLMFYVGF